mmetsp:Transcript_106073/g.194631  ORF Transcript_106073/g.194631 Transcript_106073/m.194631 type:complete len:106 (+) Transcript_106073:197-514(+)
MHYIGRCGHGGRFDGVSNMSTATCQTDLPEAASEAEFAEAMGVNGLGDRPVKVFCTSCVKRTGLADSLNWIQEQLFERRARIPVQTPPETCTTSAAADMEDDLMV